MSKLSESINDICSLIAEKTKVGFGITSPQAATLEQKLLGFEEALVESNQFPHDWEHRHSIGKGNLASVMWIVFLPPGQTTQDGIYVSFCFGKAGNGLVAGCAISNTSKKKYSYVPTVKRPDPKIDVDGTRPGTHYNDGFVNPLEVFAGSVDEEKLLQHIKESIDKCEESLNMVTTKTSVIKSHKAEERYEVWKKFIEKWPATTIPGLTLDDYTSFGGEYNSFCNWVEVHTGKLGSVWGGSSYKFGIFKRDPSKLGVDDSTHGRDETYGWYKRYGNSAQTVFTYVKTTFAKIIAAIQSGDLEAIDDIDFGHAIKWKIAFLYQSQESPILLPIYKKKMLIDLTGMSKQTPTSAMQKKLMDAKPAGMDLFDYYDKLLEGKSIDEGDDDEDELDDSLPNEPFDSAAMVALREAIKKSGLRYDDALVNRFVAALCAKPFVVLSGLSGSGKTKLAQAFANWMFVPGLNNVKLIPVGADWTNNEHLLGYPNALDDKQYVMPDTGVLKFMIEAQAHNDVPYFLILDEMNLSHVERYFADFLSAMESAGDIKLYDDNDRYADGVKIPKTLEFPKNLYVIGTMNVDETTYMFSPKVLDRAQVIEFRIDKDAMKSYLSAPTEIDMAALTGKGAKFAKSFYGRRSLVPELAGDYAAALCTALSAFFEPLAELGAEFGYRTAFEVTKFVSYYCDMGVEIVDAIDAAVLQKLLPKLHGSQARLGPVLEKLSALCDGKYPLSLDKIGRMQKRLEVGFTSFAEA